MAMVIDVGMGRVTGVDTHELFNFEFINFSDYFKVQRGFEKESYIQ